MDIRYIGALTSTSTRYSYRAWENEKLESFDPFDASGFLVCYNVYNNIVIKSSPVASKVANWCTDKVRHFIDNFASASHVESLIILRECSKDVISWFECIKYLSTYLYTSFIYTYINYLTFNNYFLYDVYINIWETYALVEFFKKVSLVFFINTNVFFCNSLLLYLGFFKLVHLEYKCCMDLIYYCSHMDYKYPYLFLAFKKSVYIVGCINIVSSVVAHNYLCVLSIYKYIMGIYKKCNAFKFKHVWDGFICSSVSIAPLIFEVLYNSVCYILSIIFFQYLNYLYNISLCVHFIDISKFSNYCILVPYGYYYFEYLSTSFISDQVYGSTYIFINVDSIGYTMQGMINLLFTHYILGYNMMYDLIIPIYLYIETNSINIDYYGYLYTNNAVIVQLLLFSISTIIIYYYSIFTSYLCLIFNVNTVLFNTSRFYINTCVYNLVKYAFFINFYINYILCKCVYIYCNLVISPTSTLIQLATFNNPLLYRISFSHTLEFIPYYIDCSTYFLTGTYCHVSKFISRYRDNTCMHYFTFI